MNLKKLFDDTIASIDKDRTEAEQLLQDVSKYLGGNPDRYVTAGMTAAKYLEVLQRSNEQRVKLLNIMIKNTEDDQFGEVSEEEANGMYEEFENEDQKETQKEETKGGN